MRDVDYRAVTVDTRSIAFDRPGMAVTLNGIAQGYITDRVADLLGRGGLDSVLVDLGETRALGDHPAGRKWRVGLADPRDPDRVDRAVDLSNLAVATSAGHATRFDTAGRRHHLFDPRTGRSATGYLGVSVVARTATAADALSTGLMCADVDRIETRIARLAFAARDVPDTNCAIVGRRE